MIFSIVFVIVFIIGFAFGIAIPFILQHLGIYKNQEIVKDEKPSSLANEILDEYMNGKRGA